MAPGIYLCGDYCMLWNHHSSPNCCFLSLDCSLFSIGTISANTNQGLYSTLSYIWHSLKGKHFWVHVSCKLVEEINIFRGNMCHLFSSLREDPCNDKCCSNGFCPNSLSPPPLKQPDPLGLLFSPKISQFFKTAVLTMGIDIFKMTMVKYYS